MTNTNMPGWGQSNTWNFFYQAHSAPPSGPDKRHHQFYMDHPVIIMTLNGVQVEVPVSINDFKALQKTAREYEREQAREKAFEQTRKQREQENRDRRAYEQRVRQERERERAQRQADDLNDAFRRAREAFGDFSAANKPKPLGPFDRLAEIAGVDVTEARQLPRVKLLRKAQRNAHPDTGGTHELWLEVDSLKRRLGY